MILSKLEQSEGYSFSHRLSHQPAPIPGKWDLPSFVCKIMMVNHVQMIVGTSVSFCWPDSASIDYYICSTIEGVRIEPENPGYDKFN